MLNDDDVDWLIKQLVASAEALGQQITSTAAMLIADDLSVYPKDVLARALSRVRNEHTGRLTQKAIIDRIDESAGRPAANEAWAIALEAMNEANTLVWNNEICEAWAIARPIAEAGDMIGARMGFIAAYERIVRNARDLKQLPQSVVSLGWDKATTNTAIEKALTLGYITPAVADQHRVEALPAPVIDGRLLLTGQVAPTALAPQEIRERLATLREELAGRTAAEAQAAAARAEAKRREWAERQADAQRRVDERLAVQATGRHA